MGCYKKSNPYASNTPLEFVAETYACLLNDIKLDDKIMHLYEKYGGPKIA